jgi:NCS1 family nucleobase:cation symporter-1
MVESSIVPVVKASAESQNLSGRIWKYILWLTIMVGFWATMSLSIADITRYAATQKAQAAGQFIGLPGTMLLYSFVGVFVTCAAIINFDDILVANDAPWDPVSLLAKFNQPIVVVFSQIAMIIATLSTNIAANVIAPANAFSNLSPKRIDFRWGGVITGIIGIVICPWLLLDEISGILIFISGLLGPVLGIMLADYFPVRRKEIQLADLYRWEGVYRYFNGYNPCALIALVAGVGVALIGYFVPALGALYNLSWFTGFLVSFILYYLMMPSERS